MFRMKFVHQDRSRQETIIRRINDRKKKEQEALLEKRQDSNRKEAE
jgi:hypothetical protein